jgi:preprotein translocase subunit SecD
MTESLRGRLITCAVITAIGMVWVAPNFFDTSKIWWPTKEKLNYGLDIQGGLHLGLGIDVAAAMKDQSNKQATSIKNGLKTDKNIEATVDVVDPNLVALKITFQGPAGPVEDYLDLTNRGAIQVTKSGMGFVEVQYYDSYLVQFKKNLVEKAREVIANRIDEFGVAEPVITIQGEDRILVQLPGLKDTESAKNLINRTAKLEFMIVDKDTNPDDVQKWIDEAEKAGNFGLGKEGLRYSAYVEKLNEALKTKLPKNTVVRFMKAPAAKNLEAGKVPMLLRTDAMMGGDTLDNAYTTNDPQDNSPQVAFSFNDKGAREFGDLTTQHTKELMAIVLDGVIQSAPQIRGPITGGNGVIQLGQGNFQDLLKEANLLSMVLRSGALPVNLELVEERAVGPSLGADSIAKGQKATLIGAALVILFMLVYYKVFGLIADIAVIVNMILLFAVLSSLRATLTLPGIAGIALTVGMAVDANIIIFEKIRDEISKGASLIASVRDGFGRAFWTIFDSNVTTMATCVILMYYGSGPIRGFAISLTIGLAVSMFTAIYMSRALIELFVVKFKWKIRI